MQRVAVDNRQPEAGMYVVSVLLGLLGVVMVLLCTSRYGVGLASDSANYLSGARSLLAGQGYRYFDGGICTHFPPLFPTLLAIPGLAGVDPAPAARWLNALAFGGIVFFVGRLFVECTTSRVMAVLGTLSVLLATPLLTVSSMAWSEAVFILLAVLSLLCLARLGHRKSWGTLATLSVLVGLACLERYAGVTLILTGAIAISVIVPAASVRERLAYAVGFCLFSSVLPGLWFLRNHMLAGQTTGLHHMNWRTLGDMGRLLVVALDIMATWFSSRFHFGTASGAVMGLVLLLVGAAAVVSRWKPCERRSRGTVVVWTAGLFVLVYTTFMAFCGASLSWDPEQRHMTPAYVFVMLLVFAGVEDGFRLLGTWFGGRAWVRASGLVLMALWLFYPLRGAYRTVRFAMREGAGAYSTRLWQQSALMDWLRANPLEGTVYSNVCDALYLLAEIRARQTPHHWMDVGQFTQDMASSTSYVVWSHNLDWPFLYDLRELRSRWRLEPVAELSDGAVYRFLGTGGPPVFGVYRFWSPQTGRHLYTLDRRERDELVLRHAGAWANEGAAFYVYSEKGQCAGAQPVYRLWSQAMQVSFYTMNQAEKDAVLANSGDVWESRQVAWYAFPEEAHPPDTQPVYRFWSGAVRSHFYTINPGEKDRLIADASHVWTYEGVAWYAYGK